VNGTDPFRDIGAFIEELQRRGFSGVQNFPTVDRSTRTASSGGT
jgi:predicted TIM-barrel enzyme